MPSEESREVFGGSAFSGAVKALSRGAAEKAIRGEARCVLLLLRRSRRAGLLEWISQKPTLTDVQLLDLQLEKGMSNI
uniref:Uncharacterized protein n=1 Tax=Sphaerodactylus townsendi TaxID=933632 RepID=A0ACB8G9B1_9SAUR